MSSSFPHNATNTNQEASYRASRRISRAPNNRGTIFGAPGQLETPGHYGQDVELSAPWPGWIRPPAPPWASQRWTAAFDGEARATRLSFLADHTLLPSAPRASQRPWPGIVEALRPPAQNTRWLEPPERRESSRLTWLVDMYAQDVNVWNGHFEVENRGSFFPSPTRKLELLSWLDDDEDEKLPSYREPLTEEQLKQADSALVNQAILEYPFPGYGTKEDPYLIGWVENDEANPMEFSSGKKWMNAWILMFAVFLVSIASSGFSQGTTNLETEFGVSNLIATLPTSLFVFGFSVGALTLAPLSEVYGRRGLFVGTYATFVLGSGLTVVAPNIATVLVLRFIAGLAGSYAQNITPAIFADIFTAQQRGILLSIFTLSGLTGQMIGPIACGFLVKTFGWRSIPVLFLALSLPTWMALTISLPETYAPVLLHTRATKMTKILGKTHVVDGIEPKSIGQQLRISTLRPWLLLFLEPIVTLISLFLSVVHGTLFLLFAAYPVVFQQVRGWPQGIASLPLLAVALGFGVSMTYIIMFDQKRYARVAAKNGGVAPPEARLPSSMIGSIALPAGLFWFAWTNGPEVFWLVSTAAGVVFGFGMVLLYIALTNYIVDAYLGFSASAIAASAVTRYIAGAAFPLFAPGMYSSLGIHWASSVPGFMALIFFPVLLIIYKYGPYIRSKCRYAAEAEKMAAMMKR